MRRISTAWDFVGKFKYLLTVGVIVLFVGFVDDNCVWQRYERNVEISRLRGEVEKYRDKYLDDTRRLEALENHANVERLARERYYMCREGEDVFVFVSDDEAVTDSMSYRLTNQED